MSSHSGNKSIQFRRARSHGKMPQFMELIHRHLEKSPPAVSQESDGKVVFVVPLDLLRLVVPDSEVDKYSEMTVVYRRKATVH